jgi:hypothetical protein
MKLTDGMDEDPPEFDFMRGFEKAHNGMEQANTSPRIVDWALKARDFYKELPTGTEFSADDLTRKCGLPDSGPNRNNVVGAWFSALAKESRIRFTGRMRKSERVDRHVGLQRIWRKVT